MKKTMTFVLAAAAACVVVSGAAQATVYNASVASPPGVYYGSGNVNGGFAVETSNNIELALRAIQRSVGPLTSTGNVYNVQLGADPTNAGRAWWNFDLSVNLAGSALNLGQVTPTLSITNVGNGNVLSFNPFTAFGDNAGFDGTSTKNGNGVGNQATATDIGFQNSENLVFFPGLGYNMNTNDTYNIVLSLMQTSNSQSLGSVDISVVAGNGVSQTPLPAALPLFASGVFGIGGLSFWRRKKAAKLAA